MPRQYTTTPLVERLWRTVDRSAGPDGCWLWLGHVDQDGYGSITRGRAGSGSIRVHRLAWELANGPIPPGMEICHTCDTPRCCNPAHLWAGTRLDNARDMVRKGRGVTGERNIHARMCPATVREIRAAHAAGATGRSLAARFGICEATVSQIVRRKTWRHVA